MHINPILILLGTQIQLKYLRQGPVYMVSDPSALLLLKYGIPCHKSSETLHLRSNLGHKLVHGATGSAHACSAQTFIAYVLIFVAFNVKSSIS